MSGPVRVTITTGTGVTATQTVYNITGSGARGPAGEPPVLNTLPDEPTILDTDIGLLEETDGTQKKFTFANLIVYVTEKLTGFLRLAGVAGGQVGYGGTESGDSLDFIGNTQGDGDINLNGSTVSKFNVAYFPGGTDTEAAQVTISSGTLVIKAIETHGRISTGGDHAWTFTNFGVGRHDFERLLTVTVLTTISLQSGWVVASSSAETLSALAVGTYLVTGSSFNGAATGQIYVGLIA